MFQGHQGASSRTCGHVAGDGLAGGRVVPGQGEVDRAGGDDQLVRGRECCRYLPHGGEELGLGEAGGVRLDLEGADSWGQVRDALEVGLRHRLHQGVDPHALGQVQLHGAEFDEEVVVAAAAEGDVSVPRQDAAVHDVGAGRAVDVHRDEPDGVTRPELAQFPALLADDRGRAYEAAE